MSDRVDRLLRGRQEAVQITILGDRQVGKTHLAMLAAIFDASQGLRVLWESHNGQRSGYELTRATEIIEVLGVTARTTRANGKHGIYFPTGGYIHFRSVLARGQGGYDLQVADDHYGDIHTPKAKSVIRTVCTQVGLGLPVAPHAK